MRDQDLENEADYIAISVDGKLVHQGKHVGAASVAKLLEQPEVVVVPLDQAKDGDIVGIATGENYQPVNNGT